MPEASEVELLQQAQAGDMDAFAELQSRLEAPIRRFVWRLIGTHPEEDDIVQDSIVAFYLNLDRIQPADNLRPYLFRIVRNRCYDLLRKLRRFDPVSLDEETVEGWGALHETLPSDESQPEEVAHWLMLHMEVQTAINRLPELQRQALILYAEEKLTYNEIAEVMNTSIGTVKSRLFYAKRTLRQLLSAETVRLLDEAFSNHRETEIREEKQYEALPS